MGKKVIQSEILEYAEPAAELLADQPILVEEEFDPILTPEFLQLVSDTDRQLRQDEIGE